jgi:hypothetical protein
MRKYSYPSDKQAKATQNALKQADVVTRGWAGKVAIVETETGGGMVGPVVAQGGGGGWGHGPSN